AVRALPPGRPSTGRQPRDAGPGHADRLWRLLEPDGRLRRRRLLRRGGADGAGDRRGAGRTIPPGPVRGRRAPAPDVQRHAAGSRVRAAQRAARELSSDWIARSREGGTGGKEARGRMARILHVENERTWIEIIGEALAGHDLDTA